MRDCQAQGYTYNVDESLLDFVNWILKDKPRPPQATYDLSEADCNATGLTAIGKVLIEEMMDLEFIIDIDHMSKLMVDEVMTMAKTVTTARPNKYPLVSSHSGFQSKQSEKSEFSLTDAQLTELQGSRRHGHRDHSARRLRHRVQGRLHVRGREDEERRRRQVPRRRVLDRRQWLRR